MRAPATTFLTSSLSTVAEVEPARRDPLVVEALEPVIHRHERGLVPGGATPTAEERCRFVHGDVFTMSDGAGFDPAVPDRLFDAVLVDIDHSARHLLADVIAGFDGLDGSRRPSRHLRAGGAVALWSNDPPDETHLAVLRHDHVAARVVSRPNRLQDRVATNTVHLATRAD